RPAQRAGRQVADAARAAVLGRRARAAGGHAAHAGAVEDAVAVGEAGVAGAALVGERADLSGRDAAAGRAVVAVGAVGRGPAVAAGHPQAVLLAAIDLRREAAAAVVAGAGVPAAHVPLPVPPGRGARRAAPPGWGPEDGC